MPVPQLNFTPYINPYVEGATKEYAGLQDRLRQDYDSAAEQYDVLEEASKTMSALPIDEELKNEILQETQGRIKTAAERGDYENLGRIARRESREFAAKYKPVLEQVQNRQEIFSKLDKLFAEGKIKKDVYEASKQYSDLLYTQTGGVKNQGVYTGYNPAQYVNIAEEADKLIEGWKADKKTTIPVLSKDGKTYISKTIEEASPIEIYNTAYETLSKNPEVSSFVNQQVLFNNLNPNRKLSDYNTNDVIKIKSKNPEFTETDIMNYLDTHNQYHSASNLAAQKHGYKSVDFDWKFNPEFEEEAKRKSGAFTSILTSSSTDFKVDLNTIGQQKVKLAEQITDLDNKINSTTDPIIKSELLQQKKSLNSKLRLQQQFSDNINKKMNWDWNKEYNNYLTNAKKEGISNILSQEQYELLSTTSPQGDYTNTVIAGQYGINNAKLLAKQRMKYSKAIDEANKNNVFKQEHELLVGNEETFSGKYTKNLNNALKNGSVEFLNQDGSQFDYETQFKDTDLNTISIIPTKGLIGGKPGYSVSATDKDGKNKKTYFVVMDDNSSNIEEYEQSGYDLLEQSKTSKYSSSPKLQNKLKNTGLMQIGYSDIGSELSDLNLPLVKGGTKDKPVTLTLSSSDKTKDFIVEVYEDKGVKYFKLGLDTANGIKYLSNPFDGKTAFNSEESLMNVWGAYKVMGKNPKLLQ